MVAHALGKAHAHAQPRPRGPTRNSSLRREFSRPFFYCYTHPQLHEEVDKSRLHTERFRKMSCSIFLDAPGMDLSKEIDFFQV